MAGKNLAPLQGCSTFPAQSPGKRRAARGYLLAALRASGHKPDLPVARTIDQGSIVHEVIANSIMRCYNYDS